MHAPLVSVVLCTYNGERFLREQIDSILQQTYPNLELIISDDASTDGTKNILETFRHHANVQLVYHQRNIGFVKNFESAVRLAKGELVAFSDQDDIFLPHKMQRLVETIGNHSLVYSDSMLINEQGKELGKKLSDVRDLKSTNDSRNFFMFNAVSGHTMMVRRDLLQSALPLPEGFYHDWWIAVHAANAGGIVYLHEVLSLYRQHPKTVTKTIGNKKVPSRNLQRRYADFVHEKKWFELLLQNPQEQHKEFLKKLHKLWLTKAKGYFSWPLFLFLWQHKHVLFTFWRKNIFSQLVELRKVARGERDVEA
ncbi:glycosyltransferase family 2 protein [Aridibaculum aurantiacum]|uniref:glycosyltransferase family 2 protein n=1 Tax=Aridibaculum aurantiacum TaxID=2810307 RepID=UPI001A977930|nr:glycosyltransferase family 2 protein [Aridibaculum aurantiacum]